MTKMNPEIKARWVAALRSGDYRQGNAGHLRDVADGFCCLGVLCNLHAIAHPEIAAQQSDPSIYLGNSAYPEDSVLVWARLPLNGCHVVSIAGVTATLWQHNDGSPHCNSRRASFAEIADAIEAQL